jgi:hypothetical protein
MITRILIAATVAFGLAVPVYAATTPSKCKGLDEAACGKAAECTWRAARVKGEKSPSTGKVYKTSAKAHCTKKPTPPAAKKKS